jgi:geranylgeranylglycerol-phosphate geranylgeranyltransferase
MVESHDFIESGKTFVSSHQIKKKTRGFYRMIRPTNLFPTLYLTLTSGFIMKSNIFRLLTSKSFIAANLIILLIMSNSMILNDVFDINIDRVNNPNRPLITGDVTVVESILISVFMFALSEILNITYIPQYLLHIPRLANLLILIYTPILKRIMFIKNLSCSLLVSSTVIFTGLSAMNSDILILNPNVGLLVLTTQLIFTGSLYNEILLDIADINGDKLNKIHTIPVLFGKKETLKIIGYITTFNFLLCFQTLIDMYNFKFGILLFMLYFPFFKNLYHIMNNNYSKESIIYSVKGTIKPMIFTLFYLSGLSIYNLQ